MNYHCASDNRCWSAGEPKGGSQGTAQGGSTGGSQGGSQQDVGQETDFQVDINPRRGVDILFMVDNSPSMEQEQANLAKNFSEMMNALKDLPGGLPDLHLGVADSDVGAGDIPCNNSHPGGDWGLLWGNPTDDMKNFANVGTRSQAADSNGCGLNQGARWIEDLNSSKQKNYTGDISSVFGCIANVGTDGCGYEHQLRAVEVALTGQPVNTGFLRDDAYLAIILVTDEDDCSADQGTDMFGVGGLTSEGASLRCATRGHICNGKAIPYYDIQKGFNPPDPDADIGFQTDFKKCAPRTDNDLPLFQVDYLINKIKGIKDRPDDQIIVAGIFGWPIQGTEDSARYKIGKDPNPGMASMKDLWDYLPICESRTLGKAYGGLRLKKFVDGFNGQTFPICQGDFKDAMGKIGKAIARKLVPGCLDYWLVDTDGDPSNGMQAECKVLERRPVTGDRAHPYAETSIPACDGSATRPCWRVSRDTQNCPVTGQRIVIDRPIDSSTGSPEGPPPDTLLAMKCQTCPDPTDTIRCPH